jgi:hypothetical protein
MMETSRDLKDKEVSVTHQLMFARVTLAQQDPNRAVKQLKTGVDARPEGVLMTDPVSRHRLREFIGHLFIGFTGTDAQHERTAFTMTQCQTVGFQQRQTCFCLIEELSLIA